MIGLDVHAVSVVGQALNPDTGKITRHTITAHPAVVPEWVRRFEPPVKVVASAMIDRIVHHAEVITLKGSSYRLKHAQTNSPPSTRPENQAE